MTKFIERSGESIEEAIVILEVGNHIEGVEAEYEYLAKKFGVQDREKSDNTKQILQKNQ